MIAALNRHGVKAEQDRVKMSDGPTFVKTGEVEEGRTGFLQKPLLSVIVQPQGSRHQALA